MAAVAFVVNAVVLYQDGYKENIVMTAADVNGQFYLGQDGLSPIRLSAAHGNAAIVDMIIGPATGTDTRTATIRVNGKSIPDVVLQAANGGTVYNRQFQSAPLRVPAGATLLFTMTT
jgi:hypothetical protein